MNLELPPNCGLQALVSDNNLKIVLTIVCLIFDIMQNPWLCQSRLWNLMESLLTEEAESLQIVAVLVSRTSDLDI